MLKIENIAIFDLDGTLWDVNSHYELLNLYYKTRFWTSIIYKSFCKIFPKIGEKLRDLFFLKVSDSFIEKINFDFNYKIVNKLEEKQNNGYTVFIVSNAPREIIIKNAAKRLNVNYICAPIGKKLETVNKIYSYKKMYVCTDNKTDLDLVEASSEYYIVGNKSNRSFFTKKGYNVE